MSSPSDAHKALLQFLYLAPFGLIQADRAGKITMINPPAIKWLTRLAGGGDLTNLFDCLQQTVPRLADLSAEFTGASGTICDAYRFTVSGDSDSPLMLALTLLKLDEDNLMACLSDSTDSVTAGNYQSAVRAGHSPSHQTARTDTMTEIPDHAAFHARLVNTLASRSGHSPLAVVAIQCDQLGHLNDAYGLPQANELINAVGSRLRHQIQRNYLAGKIPVAAPVIGRLDTDRFLVLFSEAAPCEQLESETAGLVRSLSEPYQIGTQEVQTGTCAGLVFYDKRVQDLSADSILQEVTALLQQASLSAAMPATLCQRFEPRAQALSAEAQNSKPAFSRV
ncbi:MAG: diguanylate cyclase domain-containing protein [Burkholderiaceae bacterium]